MARPGIFDTDGVPAGWFDECGQDQGSFDRDLLTYPTVVPPPPPPPRPHRDLRNDARAVVVEGEMEGKGEMEGEGPSTGASRPSWLAAFYVFPEIETVDEVVDEVDYAVVHVTEGAVVRAMAAGVVEPFIDSKGRQSVVLTADDGTRYWYADIGVSLVESGGRVIHGQPIARAKRGASTVPTITQNSKPAALAGPPGEPENGSAPPPLSHRPSTRHPMVSARRRSSSSSRRRRVLHPGRRRHRPGSCDSRRSPPQSRSRAPSLHPGSRPGLSSGSSRPSSSRSRA